MLRCRRVGIILRQFRRSWSVAVKMEKPKLQVNVDITSDVVCPWCWIGKKYLDAAVERLKEDFDFQICWKPFLLNPHVPDEGVPLADHLRVKYGEEAVQRLLSGQSPVVQHGEAVGITFNPSRLVVPTKKAHILLEHAAKEGKQHDLQEVLFKAYFSEGKNISSEDVLRELLAEVGLDVERALASLEDTEAVHFYEEGVREAQRKAVTGVPHFEIYLRDNPNVKQRFSGAQPIDTLVAIINRLKVFAKV